MTNLCPHCGYDLRLDEVIERDGFRIDPRGSVSFEGFDVRLRPSGKVILSTLAKAFPRPVGKDTLIDRLGIVGEWQTDTLQTQVSWLRHDLAGGGAASPVHTIRGVGYRWGTPA